jgi:GDP-L-fucose synthase
MRRTILNRMTNLKLKKTDKIYVAGHRGLVGSAIIRQLKSRDFVNLIVHTHNELDLTDQKQVQTFFLEQKPDYVILAAAKVGGIHANDTYPADFIYQNLMIEANVIHSAYQNRVKRLLFLGSTCIYPKAAEQPMREDALLTDTLESTNEPYALAKIAGIKLCESYNRQHSTDFRSVMPTNLYGEGDNFHLENSHVIPAVMRKIHLAKCIEQNNWQAIREDIARNPIKGITKDSDSEQILSILVGQGIKVSSNSQLNSVEVELWGTGNAMREFLYVDDMAQAALFVLELGVQFYQANTQPMLSHINIGTGKDITIQEVAETIKKVIGFEGRLVFDANKPDGTPRKLIDVSRLSNMGWEYTTDLKHGLRKTYEWYLCNINDV